MYSRGERTCVGVKWAPVTAAAAAKGFGNIFFKKVGFVITHAYIPCMLSGSGLRLLTQVPRVHVCLLALHVWLVALGIGSGKRGVVMAYFEQASLLATAWANSEVVAAMACKHAIMEAPTGKKVTRSDGLNLDQRCCIVNSGSIKKNGEQIGLAIKHCGLRPGLPMFEQAANQFFALALPKGMEQCSA